MTHALVDVAVFLTLLLACLSDDTADSELLCSDFGANSDTEPRKIKSYEFCDKIKADVDCNDTLINGKNEPADEVLYNATRDSEKFFGCRNFRNFDPDRVCRMSKKLQCNGISNCDIDECNCTVTNTTNTFLCPSSGGRESCITEKYLCNGYGHCLNNEDESLCYQAHRCDDDDPNSQYVPNFRICDGYYHCENLSDESEKACNDSLLTVKSPRKYVATVQSDIKCKDANGKVKKLRADQVCDGKRDCYNWEEDDGYDDENELDCTFNCSDGVTTIHRDFLCDSYPHCPDASDECDRNCSRVGMYNNSKIANITQQTWFNESHFFPSQPKYCERFNTTKCGNQFECDNGNCLDSIKICNTLDMCDDWSDEMYCLGRFYCNNEKPLYVPYEYVCNGANECLDGSDECQNCNFDILATDESLIANELLACLVWIMGTIALLGNIILILSKGHELKTMGSKMNSVTKISTLLLVNLAMSDFLMGFYLIGIAAMERKLRGPEYCTQKKRWRSSLGCKVLGSLCLLSSECSIFMMTLITFHRLISVIFPRKVSTLGKKGLSVWYCAITTVWLIVLGLAWIPNLHVFQDIFITEAYYENNSFIGKGTKEDLQRYSKLYQNITDDNTTMNWDDIFQVIESSGIGATYKYYGLMGFYSSHGVCLHKLFTKTDVPSWGYSLFLIVFNSICFIFIVVAYCYILTVSKKMTSAKSKGSSRMARKVQRLIIIDSLCWCPVFITAYLYITGVYITDQMYAFTAILFIPINSCFNPIAYTDISDKAHIWLLKYVLRVSESYSTTAPNSIPEDNKINDPRDQLTMINQETPSQVFQTGSGSATNSLPRESSGNHLAPQSAKVQLSPNVQRAIHS